MSKELKVVYVDEIETDYKIIFWELKIDDK
jgi:hypothetical protein